MKNTRPHAQVSTIIQFAQNKLESNGMKGDAMTWFVAGMKKNILKEFIRRLQPIPTGKAGFEYRVFGNHIFVIQLAGLYRGNVPHELLALTSLRWDRIGNQPFPIVESISKSLAFAFHFQFGMSSLRFPQFSIPRERLFPNTLYLRRKYELFEDQQFIKSELTQFKKIPEFRVSQNEIPPS